MMNNVIFIGYDYITDMEKMMPAAPAQQIIYSGNFTFLARKTKNRLLCRRFSDTLFSHHHHTSLLTERPKTSERINRIRKIKNKIFAMEAAPAAMPPNPKIAATIATIRNITVQRSITKNFRLQTIMFSRLNIPVRLFRHYHFS